MFKAASNFMGRRETSTSAHSTPSVAEESNYTQSEYTRSEYTRDYDDEEASSIYSDASSLTEENIYLTSASVCSTVTDIDQRSRSGLRMSSKISLQGGPRRSSSTAMMNMMSSHKIQDEKGSRRSIYGDQFEAAGKPHSSNRVMVPSDDESTGASAVVESRNASPTGNVRAKKQTSLKVTLDDFNIDHLKIQNELCDDEDSCEQGEAWIVKKLEKNSPELYWLQLTTEIEDPNRLVAAMRNNKTVRNATVYPSALKSLATKEKADLVDATCRLPNLKNLIVFQDCGSLFLDPLIRYSPKLTRLTLYKLNFAEPYILHKLIMLIAGLPLLEELNMEKYHAVDTAKLLRAISGIVFNTTSLRSLSLTPARRVKVSSEGLHALINAFNKNNSVKTLHLQGSEAGMDLKNVESLSDVLETNTSLGDVKFTGFFKSEEEFWSRVPSKLTEQIQFHLDLNRSGVRTLQLDVNANLATLKNAMVTNKDNLDVIFYLISNNPVLAEVGMS